MRGRIAPQAEVARRADQAAAKIFLPHAVHQDASRERIVWGDDRTGQLQAAGSMRKRRSFFAAQESDELPRDRIGRLIWIATREHARVYRMRQIGHSHRSRWRVRAGGAI